MIDAKRNINPILHHIKIPYDFNLRDINIKLRLTDITIIRYEVFITWLEK